MSRQWVILCDLRASKKVRDYNAHYAQQKRVFAQLNQTHRDVLPFPWAHIRGIDEFGCVATSHAWRDMLITLWMQLHPLTFRTVAVLGNVTDMGDEGAMRDAHGSAIHTGARLMSQIHQEACYLRIRDEAARTQNRQDADMGHLLYTLMHTWTPRQMTYFRLYYHDRTQAQVAAELGITQASVGGALARMHARYLRDILHQWCHRLYAETDAQAGAADDD